jgi:hypothetical protein
MSSSAPQRGPLPSEPPDRGGADGSGPPKPLTDPADLFHLLTKMFSSFVLFWLTVFWIVKTSTERDQKLVPGYIALTVTTGLLSLFVQRGTMKLWRRLREERAAAEVERDAALAARTAGQEERT